MINELNRNIKDAAKTVVTALPAAGANVDSTPLDLEQVIGGNVENVVLELSVPATDSLVNEKLITFSVKDGAASNSLAAIDPAMSTTVVGTAGNVSAAKVVRFRLPPNTRRYVSINASVPADAGTVTDVSYTVSLLF